MFQQCAYWAQGSRQARTPAWTRWKAKRVVKQREEIKRRRKYRLERVRREVWYQTQRAEGKRQPPAAEKGDFSESEVGGDGRAP